MSKFFSSVKNLTYFKLHDFKNSKNLMSLFSQIILLIFFPISHGNHSYFKYMFNYYMHHSQTFYHSQHLYIFVIISEDSTTRLRVPSPSWGDQPSIRGEPREHRSFRCCPDPSKIPNQICFQYRIRIFHSISELYFRTHPAIPPSGTSVDYLYSYRGILKTTSHRTRGIMKGFLGIFQI